MSDQEIRRLEKEYRKFLNPVLYQKYIETLNRFNSLPNICVCGDYLTLGEDGTYPVICQTCQRITAKLRLKRATTLMTIDQLVRCEAVIDDMQEQLNLQTDLLARGNHPDDIELIKSYLPEALRFFSISPDLDRSQLSHETCSLTIFDEPPAHNGGRLQINNWMIDLLWEQVETNEFSQFIPTAPIVEKIKEMRRELKQK